MQRWNSVWLLCAQIINTK